MKKNLWMLAAILFCGTASVLAQTADDTVYVFKKTSPT